MSFLSNLTSKFSSESKKNDPLNNNPNFIVKQTRIIQTLKSLLESHVHIIVVFADKTEHASRLIDVTEKGILIDHLNSRAAHTKILASSKIKIQAKHGKIPCDFTTHIIPSSQSGAYLIAIPEKIYHPQKRDFVRVNLQETDKYKFSAVLQFTENKLEGYLNDASFGGVCLSSNSDLYIKKGDTLSQVTLNLRNNKTVHCDLDVCSVRKSPYNGSTLIGCEFDRINNKEKKIMHKFINECARENRKKSTFFSK